MSLSLMSLAVWLTGYLQEQIARHGHAHRIDSALQLRLWHFVRDAGDRVAAILRRIEAGTLRRHPGRRRPTPGPIPRRPSQPSRLPRGRGWMQRLMPELAYGAGNFALLTQQPAMARLIAETPQLRRALSPLARAFDVRLPPPGPRPPAARAAAPEPRRIDLPGNAAAGDAAAPRPHAAASRADAIQPQPWPHPASPAQAAPAQEKPA